MVIGQVFDGKYEIVRSLGSGGMSTVYLARNIKLGSLWAIKVGNKKQNEKFDLLAEPNIMRNLNHPGIARIFDIMEDEDNIYIIEDYIDGVSIEEELKTVGKFNEKTVIEWAKQIAEALNYLHNQKPNPIIYRDMKPANLMLTKDGKVKIVDFGIAREFKQESVSDTTYIGTRGYAAPEQYGKAQSDARTDVYALGVTLYHLVTGKGPNDPPYEILPIRDVDPNLSSGLEYIITKCTKLNPDERYPSVERLLTDLTNIYKLNSEYKRAQILKDLKLGSMLVLLILFSLLTKEGFAQLQQEKIDAYESMIQTGLDLERQKDYPKAIAAFNLASKKIPERIDGYKEIALAYLGQGDYEKCISFLEETMGNQVANAQKDPNIYYILGTAYFDKQDYTNAAVNFTQASRLLPTNVSYKRDLAVSLAKAGKIEEANATLKDIQNNGSAEEYTWYVSGEILSAQKNYQEAIKSFEQGIATAKDEVVKTKAFIALAQTYKNGRSALGQDAIDKQIETLERASNELKEKNNILIIEMLGEAYYEKALVSDSSSKTNFNQKSVEKFESLIDLGYRRPYIYRNIGVIYQQMHDYSQSEAILLKMKELYPEDYTCYMQLAFLYAEIESTKSVDSRNYEKTVSNYELALKYSPEGQNTLELRPLINLIDELRAKKWI